MFRRSLGSPSGKRGNVETLRSSRGPDWRRRLIGARAGDEALKRSAGGRGKSRSHLLLRRPAEGFSGPATHAAIYFASISRARYNSSVVQSFKVLCDCSQIRIGCDDLEVAATNSSKPPFAHLRYRLASDKTAKLRTEASVPADDEGPEPFSYCRHIRSSRPARHIPTRRRKKRRRFWAE